MFNGSSCQCRVLQITVNQSISFHYHPFSLFSMCIRSSSETVLSYRLCICSLQMFFEKLQLIQKEELFLSNTINVLVTDPLEICLSTILGRLLLISRLRHCSCDLWKAGGSLLSTILNRNLGNVTAGTVQLRYSLLLNLLLLKEQIVSKEGWGFSFSLLHKRVQLFV